jgi:uncharacterized protein (DUF2249 family)
MERILDALADLPPGDRLSVIHRREPYPLYDLLRRMGYRWETSAEGDRFRLLISTPCRSVGARPVDFGSRA